MHSEQKLMRCMEELQEIIDLQSDIIRDLYQLLCLHVASDELDNIPVKEKMDRAEKAIAAREW